MPRCPVCGSVRVVVVVGRSRRAFCSQCGARWAQWGSEQRHVRPFSASTRGAVGALTGATLRIEMFLDGLGIRLAGEVDMENVDRLEKALESLVARGGEVLVDCSALTFMDSTGFGVLINAAKALGDRGRVVLISPGEPIARTLNLMGVDLVPNLEVRDAELLRHRGE